MGMFTRLIRAESRLSSPALKVAKLTFAPAAVQHILLEQTPEDVGSDAYGTLQGLGSVGHSPSGPACQRKWESRHLFPTEGDAVPCRMWYSRELI